MEHKTRLERAASDKHSSLLQVNNAHKKFYNVDTKSDLSWHPAIGNINIILALSLMVGKSKLLWVMILKKQLQTLTTVLHILTLL